MKKFTMILLMACCFAKLKAQLTIQPQTHWVVSGNTTMMLNDINFSNNGSFNSGQGNIIFSGNLPTSFSGGASISLEKLTLAKNGGTKLTLLTNLHINSEINFVSGLLDLNNNNIVLATTASLINESQTSRIVSANGGFVEISQTMNGPNSINAGNIGAVITSADNLGNVTIKRGHTVQTGSGITTGIKRYYQINTQSNGPTMTLRLNYFDEELNGQGETNLVQFQSSDAGTNWTNLGMTSNSTTNNYVEKTGVNQQGLFTLANDQPSGPVGTINFSGTRKKSTEVQLKWTSSTENNMSHYIVERKLSTELLFTPRATVNSLAILGNSSSPINYNYTDLNSHTGNSLYRLAIVDRNGTTSYSGEILVAAKTAGAKGGGKPNNLSLDESAIHSTLKGPQLALEKSILVGPNPNNGNFWFNLKGVSKKTDVVLFGIDGKIMKRFSTNGIERMQVSGLSRGMYILKADGFDPVRILVQ